MIKDIVLKGTGKTMEILKVVIADDEVRICQLIQALVDWDPLGMKLARRYRAASRIF